MVTEAPAGGGSFVDLVRGALLFITRVKRSIEIRTPFVERRRSRGQSSSCACRRIAQVITVFEGTVRATNPQGMLLVGAGQQGVAIQGQAPQLQVIVRPRDAVQWALVLRADPAVGFFRAARTRSRTRRVTQRSTCAEPSLLLSAGQLDAGACRS